MKDSVLKLVERLRSSVDALAHGHGPKSEPPSGNSLPFFADGREFKSGMTVFDDRPLRFRALTMADDGLTGFEDPQVEPAAFKIRVAKIPGFRQAAGTLIERRYGDRGYTTAKTQARDPNVFTFVAYDEGHLVGTVSLRFDSEKGLSADALYKDEIDVLRNEGCTVCEYTRLAVDEATVSKPVLAGLFHTAYLYASAVRGCTFAVIEVNPRHVAFYRRSLGFEPIGPERQNRRVNAPAVLLCVAFSSIAERVKAFGGRHEEFPHERSLFTYGFSPQEEAGILQRLKDLEQQPDR